MILKASRFGPTCVVLIMLLPTLFCWWAVANGETPFYIPLAITQLMLLYYFVVMFMPNTTILFDGPMLTIDGEPMSLQDVDYYYEDPGCVIIRFHTSFPKRIFRGYINICSKEAYISGSSTSHFAQLADMLALSGIRKKQFLWKRCGYLLW